MRKQSNRWIALGTLGALAATTLGALGTPPANAGAKQRKLLMYGAGATTVYGLLTHRRALAVAGAVGTGVAYHNYRAAQKRENRRAAYRYRYGRWARHN